MSDAWEWAKHAAGDAWDGVTGHSGTVPPVGWGTDAQGIAQQHQQQQLGSEALASMQAVNRKGAGLADQGQGQQDAFTGFGNAQAGQYGQLAGQYAGRQAPGMEGLAQGSRGQNQAALGLVGQAAQGNGPSAAQAQLQQGLEQGLAAQQATANSARGGFGLANAQHAAGMNAAQLQGTTAQNAAMLRAQEMQQAQGQYLQGSANLYGQDASLQQQQQNMNAQQQLAAMNAGTAAQYQGLQGGSQANLAYQQAGLGVQQNALATGLQLQQGYEQQGLGALGAASGQDMQNRQVSQGVISGNANNASGLAKGVMSMVGGGAAAAASDERVKTDIHPEGSPTDRVLSSLQPNAFRYSDPTYEPRSQPNGQPYLGIMAQDLERTPEGAQAVERGPDGVRRINPGAGLGLALAGEARLHQRLSALEARFGGGRK